MKNKRNYPLFLIDRSKHSTYQFDYVACFDRELGFVAKVVHFISDEQFNLFIESLSEDMEVVSCFKKLNKGAVVLVIEDFLYYFEWTAEIKTRIKTLLKKAMKKYIYAEVDRTAFLKDGLGIEEQIKQQKQTVERAKSKYEELVKRCNGDTKNADYIIALAEATLRTLEQRKETDKYLMNFKN